MLQAFALTNPTHLFYPNSYHLPSFSSNSLSRNQSTSFTVDLLSGYLHTLPHPFNNLNHSLFFRFGQINGERFHQFFHQHLSPLRTTPLSVQSELYPFSWYLANLWGCPNSRLLLLVPYRCLAATHKNRQEQCLMQDSRSLKLQNPSIN